jgi:hypothetical protein
MKLRTRLLFCVLSALALWSSEAAACPICFNGRVVTVSQQLDAADQVVLAVPLTGGQFRIVDVVKGDGQIDAIITEPVSRADAAIGSGRPLLLFRNALGQRWSSAGNLDLKHAEWLRRLLAAGPPTDTSWRERVLLAVSYLENPEPFAAEIAFSEISRAPYTIQRLLKPALDAQAIERWLADPALANRRPTYTLLLGITGGPDEASRLEQRIDAARTSRDATNLAAMLAADLELRGASRVDWIEKTYFADPDRTLAEIDAALLALSVHGEADGVVPRARVIAAYRYFIAARKPMAGFVAQQLADWAHWDATDAYATLITSDAVKDPASHFAIVNYLRRSPQAAAKAALRSLAAKPSREIIQNAPLAN